MVDQIVVGGCYLVPSAVPGANTKNSIKTPKLRVRPPESPEAESGGFELPLRGLAIER